MNAKYRIQNIKSKDTLAIMIIIIIIYTIYIVI